MSEWSLSQLLQSLHEDIHTKLDIARKSLGHPGSKGDASENIWLEFLQTYLPKRYQAEKAFVVDSKGIFSEQIDVVVFDRQYSPFIFDFKGAKIVPAESVYAVFEAKQVIDAAKLKYACGKIESVRNLYRTSLPIPTANGLAPAKPLHHIFGGYLALGSDWSPPLGQTLIDNLGQYKNCIDIGCVAAHGYFLQEDDKANPGSRKYRAAEVDKPATAFLFHLIALLQSLATAPMIDVLAYADWLTPDE